LGAFDAAGVKMETLLVEPDAMAGRVGLADRDRVARVLTGGVVGGGVGDLAARNKLIWLDGASRFETISKRDQGMPKADHTSASDSEFDSSSGLGLGMLWFTLVLAIAEMFLARFVSHAETPRPTGVRTNSTRLEKPSRAKGAS